MRIDKETLLEMVNAALAHAVAEGAPLKEIRDVRLAPGGDDGVVEGFDFNDLPVKINLTHREENSEWEIAD